MESRWVRIHLTPTPPATSPAGLLLRRLVGALLLWLLTLHGPVVAQAPQTTASARVVLRWALESISGQELVETGFILPVKLHPLQRIGWSSS
jgi:hypothetical protein